MRRLKNNLIRLYLLRNVDTIPAIRSREEEFLSMRQRICEKGTDNLEYFGSDYKFEGGFFLQQNPDEFAALALFLRGKGPFKNYLEIGTASGGCCRFLHSVIGFQNVFIIDDGQHPRAIHQKEHLSHVPNLSRFIGSSHSFQAKKFLKENLKSKLDLVFIDGDHSYNGLWQDLQLSFEFSRTSTLFILHDTVAASGVEDLWLKSIRKKIIFPLAEYIGEKRPMGIGVCTIV